MVHLAKIRKLDFLNRIGNENVVGKDITKYWYFNDSTSAVLISKMTLLMLLFPMKLLARLNIFNSESNLNWDSELLSFWGYLGGGGGRALAFVWDSALRGGFDIYFWAVFG